MYSHQKQRPDQADRLKHERQRISPLPFVDNLALALQRLNISSLPALRSLHNVELHGLAFLQTLKSV